jgi:hypothetical protein
MDCADDTEEETRALPEELALHHLGGELMPLLVR